MNIDDLNHFSTNPENNQTQSILFYPETEKENQAVITNNIWWSLFSSSWSCWAILNRPKNIAGVVLRGRVRAGFQSHSGVRRRVSISPNSSLLGHHNEITLPTLLKIAWLWSEMLHKRSAGQAQPNWEVGAKSRQRVSPPTPASFSRSASAVSQRVGISCDSFRTALNLIRLCDSPVLLAR